MRTRFAPSPVSSTLQLVVDPSHLELDDIRMATKRVFIQATEVMPDAQLPSLTQRVCWGCKESQWA